MSVSGGPAIRRGCMWTLILMAAGSVLVEADRCLVIKHDSPKCDHHPCNDTLRTMCFFVKSIFLGENCKAGAEAVKGIKAKDGCPAGGILTPINITTFNKCSDRSLEHQNEKFWVLGCPRFPMTTTTTTQATTTETMPPTETSETTPPEITSPNVMSQITTISITSMSEVSSTTTISSTSLHIEATSTHVPFSNTDKTTTSDGRENILSTSTTLITSKTIIKDIETLTSSSITKSVQLISSISPQTASTRSSPEHTTKSMSTETTVLTASTTLISSMTLVKEISTSSSLTKSTPSISSSSLQTALTRSSPEPHTTNISTDTTVLITSTTIIPSMSHGKDAEISTSSSQTKSTPLISSSSLQTSSAMSYPKPYTTSTSTDKPVLTTFLPHSAHSTEYSVATTLPFQSISPSPSQPTKSSSTHLSGIAISASATVTLQSPKTTGLPTRKTGTEVSGPANSDRNSGEDSAIGWLKQGQHIIIVVGATLGVILLLAVTVIAVCMRRLNSLKRAIQGLKPDVDHNRDSKTSVGRVSVFTDSGNFNDIGDVEETMFTTPSMRMSMSQVASPLHNGLTATGRESPRHQPGNQELSATTNNPLYSVVSHNRGHYTDSSILSEQNRSIRLPVHSHVTGSDHDMVTSGHMPLRNTSYEDNGVNRANGVSFSVVNKQKPYSGGRWDDGTSNGRLYSSPTDSRGKAFNASGRLFLNGNAS